VTRALEVYEASGRTLSLVAPRAADARARGGVDDDRARRARRPLDERIATRTRAMFDGGLIEETAALVRAGRGEELTKLRAVGYDEAIELLERRIDRAEAERRTNVRTRRLAKRQRTWFRGRPHAARLDAHEAPAATLARLVCAAYAGASAGG
jgi:tRNA dimethylallyltransferase